MEEYLECIICYDEIDKTLGDYILDICDKCKYVVHISCYEKYIAINNRNNKTDIFANICLMCHKSNITHLSNTARIENEVLIENIPVQSNKFCLKRIILVFFCIILTLIIVLYSNM
jgi:hypothetical protein